MTATAEAVWRSGIPLAAGTLTVIAAAIIGRFRR